MSSVEGYTSLDVSVCSACSVGEYTPQQGSVGSRSETVVQTCAERGEVAFCVVDVLEGGLQSDVAVQLATVCQLNGVLGALTEASALSRQSTLVETVAVGAAYLGIPVAGTLVTGVLRVLRHARHAAVGSRPHGLLGIRPPGAGGLVCSSVGRRHFAIRADGILPRVDSHAGEVVRTAVRILQLRDVEHAVLRRSHEERVVSTFPSVVASAVVQAVSECPAAPRHVEVDRKPRERIIGYGVACGDGGEDATGAVDEERGDVGREEVLAHVAHADKQMCRLPLVHVAQYGDGSNVVLCLNVRERLPVGYDCFISFCYVQRRGFDGALAVEDGHVQVQAQQVKPVGVALHVPLPLCGVFTAEGLR